MFHDSHFFHAIHCLKKPSFSPFILIIQYVQFHLKFKLVWFLFIKVIDLHIQHLISPFFITEKFTLISSLSLNSFTHVIIIKEQNKISLKLWKMTQRIINWFLRIIMLSANSCIIILKNRWKKKQVCSKQACSDSLPVYLTRVEPSQVSLYFSHDYAEVVREKS